MTSAQPGIDREPAELTESSGGKGRVERAIEATGRGLGNGVAWLAESGILFAFFALIWVVFGAALIWSQGRLDQAWQAIGDLPWTAQVAIWVLFLPVTIGLWIWETSWPLVVRLVLVIGVAGWNLLMFRPEALRAGRHGGPEGGIAP